jgi:UDP-N-acetylmuramyl pentapeptide phosphotransferase/UDP-N-acetylglucosamine-1-phosphate transferase
MAANGARGSDLMISVVTVTALIAALSSYLVAFAVCRYSTVLGFADLPNERSLHSRATPRGGGVGFALAVPILTAIALHTLHGGIAAPERALLVASAALALVGLSDDRYGLPVRLRFGVQLVAAAAVVAAGGVMRDISLPGLRLIPLGGLAVPFTIAWLVGLTNIYNFMDGIDGIAAVQAIVAAVAIGVVAVHEGSEGLALAMAILAAGVAGFLPMNWAPARIFMGDVGSTFLGFTLAGWAAMPSHRVPLMIWVAALSPFLFDSIATLVRRLLRGERVYQAHRTHFYQRLAQQGWPHARTTILYGALAAASGSIAALSMSGGAAGLLWVAAAVPLAIPLIVARPVINRSTGSGSSQRPGREPR